MSADTRHGLTIRNQYDDGSYGPDLVLTAEGVWVFQGRIVTDHEAVRWLRGRDFTSSIGLNLWRFFALREDDRPGKDESGLTAAQKRQLDIAGQLLDELQGAQK